MNTRSTLALVCCVSAIGVAALAQPAERYVRAAVNASGQLEIHTTSGQTIRIEPEPEQVGFDKIVVAPDGLSVGWVGQKGNCCTSYAIPTRLTILVGGQQRTLRGHELPVWRWKYVLGGQRVAFYQDTVHSGLGTHYELRDVASGRLVAESPEVDENGHALPNQVPPDWVAQLMRDDAAR